MKPVAQWVFPARVLRVVDGDTLDVELDCGFHTTRLERLRLLGVNAPERKAPTREAGDAALDATVRWIAWNSPIGVKWPLVVETSKSDAFGRYLAVVYGEGDVSLNDALLAQGVVEVYR